MGANENFYRNQSSKIKRLPSSKQIIAVQPNGTQLKSAGNATMCLPNHPEIEQHLKGYILPQLDQHSIVSIGKLCDVGCTAVLDKDVCKIYKGKTEVLRGIRNDNGLWYVEEGKMGQTNQINAIRNMYAAEKQEMQYSSYTQHWDHQQKTHYSKH